MIDELKYYIKKYKLFTFFIYLQTTLFLVMIGTFTIFADQLEYESRDLKDLYEGKAIYQLLDNYYDGASYTELIKQEDYLKRLKMYYHDLNSSEEDFDYLALFDHYIFLKDEGIPPQMVEGYEQGVEKYQETVEDSLFTAVKSFQMNEQAMDFFELAIQEGTTWREIDFQDSSQIMPVLLGSSYQDFYEIGDQTVIKYYNRVMNVEIIGFLKENSKVYYNNHPEFYLDDYVILPYVAYGDPLTEEDELFQQISYFAMVNGFLVTEDTPEQTQYLMKKIDAIANKASIDYSYVGVNPHFHKYRGLMTVLLENKRLVQSILICAGTLYFIVISLILLLQQKKRFPSMAIHYINGATRAALIKMNWIEISCPILAAYLTQYMIFTGVLKIGNLGMGIKLLFLCILMSIIVISLPAYYILTKSFDFYHDDKGENL